MPGEIITERCAPAKSNNLNIGSFWGPVPPRAPFARGPTACPSPRSRRYFITPRNGCTWDRRHPELTTITTALSRTPRDNLSAGATRMHLVFSRLNARAFFLHLLFSSFLFLFFCGSPGEKGANFRQKAEGIHLGFHRVSQVRVASFGRGVFVNPYQIVSIVR